MISPTAEIYLIVDRISNHILRRRNGKNINAGPDNPIVDQATGTQQGPARFDPDPYATSKRLLKTAKRLVKIEYITTGEPQCMFRTKTIKLHDPARSHIRNNAAEIDHWRRELLHELGHAARYQMSLLPYWIIRATTNPQKYLNDKNFEEIAAELTAAALMIALGLNHAIQTESIPYIEGYIRLERGDMLRKYDLAVKSAKQRCAFLINAGIGQNLIETTKPIGHFRPNQPTRPALARENPKGVRDWTKIPDTIQESYQRLNVMVSMLNVGLQSFYKTGDCKNKDSTAFQITATYFINTTISEAFATMATEIDLRMGPSDINQWNDAEANIFYNELIFLIQPMLENLSRHNVRITTGWNANKKTPHLDIKT